MNPKSNLVLSSSSPVLLFQVLIILQIIIIYHQVVVLGSFFNPANHHHSQNSLSHQSAAASSTNNYVNNNDSEKMEKQQQQQQQFKVLGVCGGIGCGKSAACKMLVSELNCLAHLDADKVAHSVYQKGSQAVQEIVAEFGKDVLQEDGEINRKQLGSIVFADRSQMSKLEQIVWPHVNTELKARINVLRQEWNDNNNDNDSSDTPRRPIVILEAAVLLDANWQDIVQGIWVIRTKTEIAQERIVSTRGLTQEEAMKRITAQASRRGMGNSESLQSDIDNRIITGIIENNGSMIELRQALEHALNDKSYWK